MKIPAILTAPPVPLTLIYTVHLHKHLQTSLTHTQFPALPLTEPYQGSSREIHTFHDFISKAVLHKARYLRKSRWKKVEEGGKIFFFITLFIQVSHMG